MYLSQLNKKPSQKNWVMAKRVLHYLKGTKVMGIMYQRVTKSTEGDLGDVTPWAFCDMNYAEDPCDHRSTSGYVFMLASGSVVWKVQETSLCHIVYHRGQILHARHHMSRSHLVKTVVSRTTNIFNEPIKVYTNNTGAVVYPITSFSQLVQTYQYLVAFHLRPHLI